LFISRGIPAFGNKKEIAPVSPIAGQKILAIVRGMFTSK
jgi:hypothetical protein